MIIQKKINSFGFCLKDALQMHVLDQFLLPHKIIQFAEKKDAICENKKVIESNNKPIFKNRKVCLFYKHFNLLWLRLKLTPITLHTMPNNQAKFEILFWNKDLLFK